MGGSWNEHGRLVQRVKAVQKQEGGQEKWSNFVLNKGGGKKDPVLKSVADLKEFLKEADPGNTAGFESDVDPEVTKLAQQVRKGQKNSDEVKQAWWAYCQKEKNDVRDPSKHDVSSLQTFLSTAPVVNLPEDNDEEHQTLVKQIKEG